MPKRKSMYKYQKGRKGYRPFNQRAGALVTRQYNRWPTRPTAGPWFPLRIGGRMGAGQKSEAKFYDRTFGDVLIKDTSTSFGLVNGILQGTTGSDRIGNQVVMKYVDLRIQVYNPQPDDDDLKSRGPGRLWIWIFMDKQSNGATPSEADIMTTSFFENPNNRARFVMLRKFEQYIGGGELYRYNPAPTSFVISAVENNRTSLQFKCRISLGNKRTFYTGTGATISSIASNAIFVFAKFIPEYPSVHDGVYVDWQSQLFFTDP